MKNRARRHVAVAMASSVGIGFVLGILLGAWAFVAYCAVYLIAYHGSEKMRKAVDRIANGKEEK